MTSSIVANKTSVEAVKGRRFSKMKSALKVHLAAVNQELWLVLSLFVIVGLINWLVASQSMILELYTLPTIFSAYVYGRRHAVLTASASVALVVLLARTNGGLFIHSLPVATPYQHWLELMVWGGLLLVTAYAMGTLYERKEDHLRELRETYFGILTILQQFISNDKYTHNHSYRVALYAANIATGMDFDEERIDDVRAAALLHDIGKLETSRDILYKAASLTPEETVEMRKHVQKGVALLEPVGGLCAESCRLSLRIMTDSMARDTVPAKAGRYPSRPEYWRSPTLSTL